MQYQENGKTIKITTKKMISLNLDLVSQLEDINISGTLDL